MEVKKWYPFQQDSKEVSGGSASCSECLCDGPGSCAKCIAGQLCMSFFECKAVEDGANVVVIEHKESVKACPH